MSGTILDVNISASEHSKQMAGYIKEGIKRAECLNNRGPARFDGNGNIHSNILNSYWEHGFYVFTNVLRPEELNLLRLEVDRLLREAPNEPTDSVQGLPAASIPGLKTPPYRFAKPLSDPLGGTSKNKGRHPVQMLNPIPAKSAPKFTIEMLWGNLHLSDAFLRLYGHPDLLAVASAVNGPDFVPYNEVTFIKEPGLGPSVAWHQDGTTHWQSPDWDQGAHGFNFMTQLYPSTAGNGVWVVPGTHKLGKVDISQLVLDSGSERITNAVPMLCDSGDVIIANRQLVHGSFANSSSDRRVTINAGFFPRKRVLNIETSRLDGVVEKFTADRIYKRSKLIPLAINARKKFYHHEVSFNYLPLQDLGKEISWNEKNRDSILKNYNLNDMYI